MPELKGIPEKIKLGDVEYIVKDHPAILEMLQSARKEEKDKLYSEIKTLKADMQVLADEKKKTGELSATKQVEFEKLQSDLAVVKAAKEQLEKKSKEESGDDDDDDDKKKKKAPASLTREALQEVLKEALAQQKKEFDTELAAVKGGLNQKTVADYRKEKLEENKGLLIERLVPENLDSREAVNKAIAEALMESKPYIRKDYDVDGKKQTMSITEYEAHTAAQKDKGDKGEAGRTQTYTQSAPAPPGGGGDADISSKELLSKVSEMSDEEYAKHHKALLKEVRSVKYESEDA